VGEHHDAPDRDRMMAGAQEVRQLAAGPAQSMVAL